jgi:hypothetical protein
VILGNQLQKVRLDDVALALRHAVDPTLLNLVRSAEERLPARDGVGADNGVRGLKVEPRVLRGSAVFVDELGAKVLRYAVEVWLMMGRC